MGNPVVSPKPGFADWVPNRLPPVPVPSPVPNVVPVPNPVVPVPNPVGLAPNSPPVVPPVPKNRNGIKSRKECLLLTDLVVQKSPTQTKQERFLWYDYG